MSSMPAQRPGHSKQDYCTPPEFLTAVKRRLDIVDFEFDLAASENNKVNKWGDYFTEEDNALNRSWAVLGWEPDTYWLWCNPPYNDLAAWTCKAATESKAAPVGSGAYVAMLVPASTGANWWRDHVVNDAYVLFLNGRLTFVGADGPYPKDLVLLLYTPFIRSGNAIWNWRADVPAVSSE